MLRHLQKIPKMSGEMYIEVTLNPGEQSNSEQENENDSVKCHVILILLSSFDQIIM